MSIRPYEDCVTRLEHRGTHPPSREYADALVAALDKAGVEASWNSAVDHVGRPLFPSRVFPHCHPQASIEAFRYLIEQLHASGRPVLSWYPLNTCRALLDDHPDWAMEFLPMEGLRPAPEAARNFICFNSPYGELLPQFAMEIVRDVGFDGIFFDGSTMSNQNTQPAFQPGCACPFCRERFKRDTSLDLPAKVDFGSRDFRIWLNWRYDVLMQVWRRVTDAVHAAKPEGVIAFNNYRRRSHAQYGWTTAIPLRRLDIDMIMGGELDTFPAQADFQMKTHKAYGCPHLPETWWPLCNYWHLWCPDVESLPGTQAMLAAMAAGGGVSTGIGVAVDTVIEPLRSMQVSGQTLRAFRRGEPVQYAAIWCSQATQDFHHQNHPEGAWNQMHGANELCLQAHLPSGVIFDDHVTAGELGRYPVILAPNVACVSDQQAHSLQAYVEEGGVLLATSETGCCDELGYRRERPVLDDLLGVAARRPSEGSPTLEVSNPLLSDAAGRWVSFGGRFVKVTPAAGVEVLADAADQTASSWDGIETGAPPFERTPNLLRRRVGRGWVVYTGVDLFAQHLMEPVPRTIRLFQALLTSTAPPPVTADAPLCVTLNARRMPDGRLAVILHNAPGTMFGYASPMWGNYTHCVGELPVWTGIVVRLNAWRCRGAVSGINGTAFHVRDGREVLVPRLETHEVLLLDVS